MNEYTLFDNYDVTRDFENVKAMLQECNPTAEISDTDVWQTLSVMEQNNWNKCMGTLKELFGDSYCIVYGSVGTWRGNFTTGRIFNDIKVAVSKIIKDCDYIEIKVDDNGVVNVKASHHDGTNNMQIKVLTDKGVEFYDAWRYNDVLTELQMLEQVWISDKLSQGIDTQDFF